MSLARLLQPSMVVIEDVDLIARDRDDMGPCEESMPNKLLNEMDGLKEDADILFVLTTNRPEDLEGALAGRPRPHRSSHRSAAARRDRPRQGGPALRQGTAARGGGDRGGCPTQRGHKLRLHQGADA